MDGAGVGVGDDVVGGGGGDGDVEGLAGCGGFWNTYAEVAGGGGGDFFGEWCGGVLVEGVVAAVGGGDGVGADGEVGIGGGGDAAHECDGGPKLVPSMANCRRRWGWPRGRRWGLRWR